MKCNALSYILKIKKPCQKISRKTQKNIKIFEKPPKPRSKMHEFKKSEKIRTLIRCFDLDLGRKCSGLGDLRARRVLAQERKFSIEREVKK